MFGVVKSLVKGVERAPYEVIRKEATYEVRKYPATKWVSTTAKSISHKEAVSQAFRRLFRYIQGDNEEKQTIDMTIPVTTKVIPGEGPNCESTFTESFYVPMEHQANPATPSNPEVFIEDRPEITVFVRTFGGFADDEKWISHGRALAEDIGDESKYHTDFYYTVGYDAPFKLWGRTNDVWFVKKE